MTTPIEGNQFMERAPAYHLDLSKLPSGALARWAEQYEDFIKQIDSELARRGESRAQPSTGFQSAKQKPAAGVQVDLVL